jgi:PAS domain S-box-containing protein
MTSIAPKGQPVAAGGPPGDNAQQFDLLLDQIVDYAIFLLDPEGFVSTWNTGAERIKGYQRDEIVGRHYNTFFLEEDRRAGKPEQILRQAIADGRYQEEGWRLRKDGTRFWASVTLTALRGPSGELRGLAKITRDLTDRMTAEEKARDLVRARALHEQAERDAQEREKLRRHRARLANLRSAVSNFAARATSVESMMDGCAHAVVEHLEAVLAQVWLTDAHGTLGLVAHRGMPELADELPATRSWMDIIVAGGQPVLRDDLHDMPRFAWARDAGATSFAAHPILNGTKVVGALAVFSRTALSAETLEAMRGVSETLVHWMERRRAEDEVRRSRDQLDLILRSISEGVSVQGPDGGWVFVNDAAARLCGCASAQEMLSLRRMDLLGRFEIRREDGTPLRPEELPGRIALQGKSSSAMLRFKTKPSGEERWSYVSAAPVINAHGQVELAVSIFHEFTERRRSEQAWQFLAQASATLGSSLDFEATLTQVTKLAVPAIADFCSLELLAEDGSLEQLAVAHVDPSKVERAKEWRRRRPPARQTISYQVIDSGTPHLIAEITDEMIDASTDDEGRKLARQLGLRSAMVVPLVVGSKPFGVLSFVSAESGRRYTPQDLIMATEIGRRASLAVENARAYGEARAAVRTRDTFLSIASHELRTPLSVMTILMSSLVRAANQGRLIALGPESLRDRLVKAERQTAQLGQLVDRLLDVTRLSAGEMTLERTELDMGVLAREVVSRFDEMASRAGCRIELKVEGGVAGRWDRSRVDQVLTNLLSNAIKYGGGAPVDVAVMGDAADVRIIVRDEGPGMAAADQERVFKQFERAASNSVPGMGLGLWIVERIVAAHGGTVTLDSAPGKGSSFSVVLPRAQIPRDFATPGD